jgi:hypothetical protein
VELLNNSARAVQALKNSEQYGRVLGKTLTDPLELFKGPKESGGTFTKL